MARVDGVSNTIRLAMLGLTGLSTATLTLRQYGHGEYAWPLIGVVGVWNQNPVPDEVLSEFHSLSG